MLTVLTQTPAFVSDGLGYGHPDWSVLMMARLVFLGCPDRRRRMPGRAGKVSRQPIEMRPRREEGFPRYRGELPLLPKPPLVIEWAGEFD
jgi:hypothetical protein